MSRRILIMRKAQSVLPIVCVLAAFAMPDFAWAQAAGSPFETGATNLQTAIIAIATPIAIILVMAVGAFALAGRLSMGWVVGAIIGIGVIFAAPTIVTWVRGLFGA